MLQTYLNEIRAKRNDPYTHFSQQPHNKLTWLVIFYYFFTKRKQKNNKILPATSACCGAVVRNECRDHFSYSVDADYRPNYVIFCVR
jgi:hypothetical protein